MIKSKKETQRTINAQETKNTIFNSALKLFYEFSYDRVTIADIAELAGVSKGNFYNHFKSKDSILVEQFRRIDGRYSEVFDKLPPGMTAGDKLRKLISTMCDYCENICGVNAIKVSYSNQISANKHVEILMNYDRPFYAYLHEIVRQGQSCGEFRDDIQEDYMITIISRYCRALVYDWCLSGDGFNLCKEGERYAEFVLESLNKPDRSPLRA